MEEKQIEQRFHLLQQKVEAAVALVGQAKLNCAAATDALTMEIEVLRRFMEHAYPDFPPPYRAASAGTSRGKPGVERASYQGLAIIRRSTVAGICYRANQAPFVGCRLSTSPGQENPLAVIDGSDQILSLSLFL
jgi:hypothetical protein